MTITNKDLKAYVYKVLTGTEGASSDRFKPGFAGGKSGLSFGYMQNDVANQPLLTKDGLATDSTEDGLNAKSVLSISLHEYSNLSDEQISDIMTKAETKGIKGKAFTEIEKEAISSSLQKNASLVNKLDHAESNLVSNQVEDFIDKASTFPNGPGVLDVSDIDPYSVALITSWANRTGGLNKMEKFLQNPDHESPQGLSSEDIEGYVSHRPQFGNGKENFSEYLNKVNTAADTAKYLLIGTDQQPSGSTSTTQSIGSTITTNPTWYQTITTDYSGPNGTGNALDQTETDITSIQYEYNGTGIKGTVTYDPQTSQIIGLGLQGGGIDFTSSSGGSLSMDKNGNITQWLIGSSMPNKFNLYDSAAIENYNPSSGVYNTPQEYLTVWTEEQFGRPQEGGFINNNAQASWTTNTSSIITNSTTQKLT